MILLGIAVYSIFVVLGALLYFNGKDTPCASPDRDRSIDAQ